jgi:hypothetical protein
MGHVTGSRDLRVERRLVPRGTSPIRIPGSPACLVSMRGGPARTAVHAALSASGFRPTPLPDAPRDAEGDLCVIDAPRIDEALVRRVVALRDRRTLRNPFAGVFLVGLAPTEEAVHAVARAGADVLMVPPLSASDVGGRIRRLAEAEREFVVTADYVGPDRRRAPRPGAAEPARVRVPNALGLRLRGAGADEIRAEIEGAWGEVGRTRAAACAFAVGFAVQRAAAAAERFDFPGCGAVAEVPALVAALRGCLDAVPDAERRARIAVFARQLDEMARDGAEDLQKLLRDLPRAVPMAAELLVAARGAGDRASAEAELRAAGRARA